jgi:hypothetical protein
MFQVIKNLPNAARPFMCEGGHCSPIRIQSKRNSFLFNVSSNCMPWVNTKRLVGGVLIDRTLEDKLNDLHKEKSIAEIAAKMSCVGEGEHS